MWAQCDIRRWDAVVAQIHMRQHRLPLVDCGVVGSCVFLMMVDGVLESSEIDVGDVMVDLRQVL